MSRVPDQTTSGRSLTNQNTARAFVLLSFLRGFLCDQEKENTHLQSKSLTPTKPVSPVWLSPKSKEALCILCLNNIVKSDNRRKLFGAAGVKTKHVSDRREFKPK